MSRNWSLLRPPIQRMRFSWFDPQYYHHNDFEALLIRFGVPSAHCLQRHILFVLQTDVKLILNSDRLFKEDKLRGTHLLCLIRQKLAKRRVVIETKRENALRGLRACWYATKIDVNNARLADVIRRDGYFL
jgi:hypothetical protein